MSKPSETPSEKPSDNLIAPTPAPASSGLTTELTPELSTEQRRILLRIAHDAILSVVERRPFPDAPPSVPGLSERRGVFTTLYLRGELRGCVGYAMPVAPLYRAVAETARAAAFEDTRFSPVTKEEASNLDVSLSVLSPLVPPIFAWNLGQKQSTTTAF